MPPLRKIGRGFLGNVRRRSTARSVRTDGQPANAGLRLRATTVSAQNMGDIEAPQTARRSLQPEAKHCAAEDDVEMQNPILQSDSSAIIAQFNQMSEDEQIEAIKKQRDKYWDEQKAALGNAFDEEEVLTAYVKDQLLKVNSTAELMVTAEQCIDEDWLQRVDGLPGNIYRLAVMGDVFVVTRLRTASERARALAKILGILTIIAIQTVGPPIIFFSRMKGLGVVADNGYQWGCCPWHWNYNPASNEICAYNKTRAQDVSYFDDWHHIATTKVLGMLVMFAFILNGFFVLLDERQSWLQVYKTFQYLDKKNPRFKLNGITFMYLDTLVNTWVILWVCIDVFLVIGPSPSPLDVLMNALGLVFLYNLDDVGGDLGFINEDDWPGLRLAWIYKEVVQKYEETEEKLDLSCEGNFLNLVYTMGAMTLALLSVALPILTAITPFIQVVPD